MLRCINKDDSVFNVKYEEYINMILTVYYVIVIIHCLKLNMILTVYCVIIHCLKLLGVVHVDWSLAPHCASLKRG